MNRTTIVAPMVILAVTITARLVFAAGEQTTSPTGTPSVVTAPVVPATPAKLPRLVDLGASRCIPCKMMAPILEELKKEYAGQLEVEFIDVWKNENAGKSYAIKLIPTQIFYDATGQERFRHEGFFSKDDIMAKWKELGLQLNNRK